MSNAGEAAGANTDRSADGEPRPKQDVLGVLLVDDSREIREPLVAMLEPIDGVRLLGTVGSVQVQTVLVTVEASRPDVVILNITLRGEDALALLPHLRDRSTVIVLTAYPYPAFRQRAAELGAAFFLSKATEFGRLPGLLTDLRDRRERT